MVQLADTIFAQSALAATNTAASAAEGNKLAIQTVTLCNCLGSPSSTLSNVWCSFDSEACKLAAASCVH